MQLPTDYTKLKPREKREVRQLYIKQQGGRCMYCDEDLEQSPPSRITDLEINWQLFPPGFLDNPIHLQHCHRTNMTEGAVHAYCNAVLWQYEGR
jgi:hypothetical protein